MATNYFTDANYSMTSFHNESHILQNVYIQAGIILLFFSMFALCFFGNLAVILVVMLEWKKRSLSKFCLLNMAVANFSVSLFCILQNLPSYFFNNSWILGEQTCRMYHFMGKFCHTATIIILVTISIERYIAVLHPLTVRQILTSRRLLLITVAVWILSAAISLPHFIHSGIIRIELNKYGNIGHICVPIKSMYNSATTHMSYFFLLYLLPLAIVSTLYIRIGLSLRQSERLRRELDEENHIAATASSGRKFCKKQLSDMDSVVGNRSISKVDSAPDAIEFVSIPTSTLFTIQGEFHSDQKPATTNWPVISARLQKWEESTTHEPDSLFIVDEHQLVHSGGGHATKRRVTQENILAIRDTKCREQVTGRNVIALIDESRGSIGASSTCSSIFQTKDNMLFNSSVQKFLYRYDRQQLSIIRCNKIQRVVRVLMFIVLTFSVLNLPHHIRKLYFSYLPPLDIMTSDDANSQIAPLTFALMYANCAINPILYAFVSKSFRASMRNLLCKGC